MNEKEQQDITEEEYSAIMKMLDWNEKEIKEFVSDYRQDLETEGIIHLPLIMRLYSKSLLRSYYFDNNVGRIVDSEEYVPVPIFYEQALNIVENFKNGVS